MAHFYSDPPFIPKICVHVNAANAIIKLESRGCGLISRLLYGHFCSPSHTCNQRTGRSLPNEASHEATHADKRTRVEVWQRGSYCTWCNGSIIFSGGLINLYLFIHFTSSSSDWWLIKKPQSITAASVLTCSRAPCPRLSHRGEREFSSGFFAWSGFKVQGLCLSNTVPHSGNHQGPNV